MDDLSCRTIIYSYKAITSGFFLNDLLITAY